MAALAVVLVHWNQPERLHAALDSWRDQGVELRITVVDNASSAESLAAVKAGLPDDVTLIECGRNLGFGPGANVGLREWLRADDTDWVAVAPHDALLQVGCLTRLLTAVSRRPLAGLACADVGDGETPIVDPLFGGLTMPSTGASADGWESAGFPHGTLLLARRTCLEEIGLFDERYFAYCEEADLGARARNAGWEVGIVRGARVVNPYTAGGSAVVDYLMLRNTLLLVREHFGCNNAALRFGLALYDLGIGTLRADRRGDWNWAPAARLLALADFTRARFGPPPDSLRT